MEQDKPDERQFEFPFVTNVETQKMEALFKVRAFDCSKERHQVLPNGTCMLCRQQIAYGNQET